MKIVRQRIEIICLILLSTTFRLAFITQEAITRDADRSRFFGMMDPMTLLSGYPTIEPHPPLYYWAVHYSIEILGPTHFGVRFPSLVAGILLVPVVYLVSTELWNRRVALLAGAITAVSPYLIHWSQTARMYSFLALFGTLSFYFFIRIDRQGLTPSRGFGYVLAVSLATYSHILGFVVLFSQVVFIFASFLLPTILSRFSEVRSWIIVWLGCGLTTVPVAVFIILRIFSGMTHGGRTHPPTPVDPIKILANFLGFGSFPHRIVFAAILVPAVSILTLLPFLRWREPLSRISSFQNLPVSLNLSDERSLLLAFWVLTPFAVLFPASFFIKPIVGNRYYIVSAVGIYILAAVGLTLIKSDILRRSAIATVFVCFILISGVYLVEVKRPAWDTGVDYIMENQQPEDIVISGQATPDSEVWYYADERVDFVYKQMSFNPDRTEICRLADGHSRIWVIGFSGREDFAADVLREFYSQRDYRELSDLGLYLFEAEEGQAMCEA